VPRPTPIWEQSSSLSLSPPTLNERRHRCLAGRLVAVRRALDVAVVPARPHPGAIRRCNQRLENAADHDAVSPVRRGLVAPLTRLARSRGALENLTLPCLACNKDRGSLHNQAKLLLDVMSAMKNTPVACQKSVARLLRRDKHMLGIDSFQPERE
jgi:hypothetical protein